MNTNNNKLSPKISVIIPVYNAEKYIEDCLISVINQPVKDLEIIITNNGCTDNSLSIIEKYAKSDSRIKIISSEHGEAFQARNLALEEASGQWIAFCDSDDTLTSDAFSVALAVGEKNGYDIVTASFNEVNDYGQTHTISINLKPTNPFLSVFSTPCIWNKLIKRDFLIRNKIHFPELVIGEDVLFLGILLLCSPKIGTANTVIYNYWYHNLDDTPSMTHRYSIEHFDMHILCREKLQNCLEGTEYERICKEYIHFEMVFFLISFLRKMRNAEQRHKAFDRFRRFVLEFDWNGNHGRFLSIFGVTFEEFVNIDCDYFLYDRRIILPRDSVLEEYKNGLIGFRYILKYLKAWLFYKFSHKH